MRNRWLVLGAATALAGCSAGRDVPAATAAIVRFHASINAGQFALTWESAAPELKSASAEPAFARLLDAVHRKLGAFKSGKATGFNENVSTSGTIVAIGYAGTYERGQAMEQFVYRMNDGRPTLAGYHVMSDALILN